VAAFDWNRWPDSIGIDGRISPEYAGKKRSVSGEKNAIIIISSSVTAKFH